MVQDWLNDLAISSLEWHIAQKVDFEDIINTFAKRNIRKAALFRDNHIYFYQIVLPYLVA